MSESFWDFWDYFFTFIFYIYSQTISSYFYLLFLKTITSLCKGILFMFCLFTVVFVYSLFLLISCRLKDVLRLHQSAALYYELAKCHEMLKHFTEAMENYEISIRLTFYLIRRW